MHARLFVDSGWIGTIGGSGVVGNRGFDCEGKLDWFGFPGNGGLRCVWLHPQTTAQPRNAHDNPLRHRGGAHAARQPLIGGALFQTLRTTGHLLLPHAARQHTYD